MYYSGKNLGPKLQWSTRTGRDKEEQEGKITLHSRRVWKKKDFISRIDCSRILPVHYSENYFSLVSGYIIPIKTTFKVPPGVTPWVLLHGWNYHDCPLIWVKNTLLMLFETLWKYKIYWGQVLQRKSLSQVPRILGNKFPTFTYLIVLFCTKKHFLLKVSLVIPGMKQLNKLREPSIFLPMLFSSS